MRRPAHEQTRGRVRALQPRAHQHVRNVEHRRTAVAPVREQEPAHRFGAAPGPACTQRHAQGDAGQRREGSRLRGDRRQGGVGGIHGVAEALEPVQPRAVAARVGDGEPARGHDDGVSLERGRALPCDPPNGSIAPDAGHAGPGHEARPPARREREQAIAHVPGPVRRREELGRLLLFHQPESQLVLEEGGLLGQRPGAHQLAQRVRRRVRHEARLVQARRQHVAAAAAADQDLAAAVERAFHERCFRPAGGREDRRHAARGPRSDHHDASHTRPLERSAIRPPPAVRQRNLGRRRHPASRSSRSGARGWVHTVSRSRRRRDSPDTPLQESTLCSDSRSRRRRRYGYGIVTVCVRAPCCCVRRGT